MWGAGAPRRIFAYTRPTDMRKSFQGLLALVQQVFTEDPYSGSAFVFVNRRGTYVKILVWDRTGFVLYAKRLERGRFVFPATDESQELSEQALRFFLDGIPLGARASMRYEERVQTHDWLAQRSRSELIAQLLQAKQDAEREREQRRTLEQQLRWFKRQLFGRRSERRLLEADPTQLCLGEGLGTEARREAPETATTVRSHVRRRRPPRQGPDEKGLRFDESVPVVTVEVPNPELEGVAAEDQEVIGEKVSYRLGQRPAAYLVAKIVRKVVKRKDTGEITTAPLPLAVLEKSYADVSLLAGLLVDKFRYHLPLYRQHQRMQAAGVSVARASLTSWAAEAAELLEPIYEAQRASIRESAVLAMDETPIRAGRRAPGRMKTGPFWPLYGDRDEVVFPYAPTRSRRVVEELLEGFSGTLLSDGFEAYERFAAQRERVTHALCWAHTRRKFVEAEDVEPERARRALEAIRQLYDQEERIRAQGLEGIAKIQARAQGSRPVVEGLFRWLEEELTQGALLPTNPFTRAALYALKRRAGLEVFLADPAVPIDTNHLERALRPIPMGKKNGSPSVLVGGSERELGHPRGF